MTQTQTADPLALEVTNMLLTAINSVYTGGATQVFDAEGQNPSESNNYLLSEDGETFSGVFVDEGDNKVAFTIRDNNGVWSLKY